MNNPEKICVIHLNQIGDLCFSLPLLKILRDHYPGAAMHSVIRPYLGGLLKDSPYVDKIIQRKDKIADRIGLVSAIRAEHYDLIIALPRSEEALLLAALSGARLKAGFAHWPWDIGLDVKKVIQGHNSWFNNARLLKLLNIPVSQDNYVGLLKVDEAYDTGSLPKKYVVISPGASKRRLIKAWDEYRFAEVITILSKDFHLGCVLVGGQDTAECTATIAMHVKRLTNGNPVEIIDLAGKISLRQLSCVLKNAELFVGIDSGVMHMASALDIPTVGIFGPTDPFYVGPQNRSSLVVRHDIPCSPCYMRMHCEHRQCLEELGADKVIEACAKLLALHS